MKAPVPIIANTYTYTNEVIIDCENGIDITLCANIIDDTIILTDTIVLENVPPPNDTSLDEWSCIIITIIIVLLICLVGIYS